VLEVPVNVTPKFLSEQSIELNVEAVRQTAVFGDGTATFAESVNTAKTRVLATVQLNFGETLVLSGLSEKENTKTKDGVPILKDIPIIQYLFSNEKTTELTRSVLILLTPRPARYTDGKPDASELKEGAPSAKSTAVAALEQRYDWFRPAPQSDVLLYTLSKKDYVAAVRKGDVTLEDWTDRASLSHILKRALRFLYY
jgi:type II secretory pathway component GspD/PulD (secretin)